VSTRVLRRRLSLAGVLLLLAASSALAQNNVTATILVSAQAAAAPSISLVTTNALGQVEPSPDREYVRAVRAALAKTKWVFLANNTLLVVRDGEVIMTLRAIPGADGTSWNVSNQTMIGNALYTVTGVVRRGIRNGTGALDRNQGTAELTLTTVSVIGRRATAHVIVPLTFGTPPTGTGTVVENGDTTTFTTAAQGGRINNGGTNGGVVSTGTGNAGGPISPPSSIRQPPGWGVRLWPVPWG